MSLETDAEFVIMGGRLRGGSIGYANDNGDFVQFERARRLDYAKTMGRAQDLADSRGAAVFVAPLLFGVPDLEVMITVASRMSGSQGIERAPT